ncbi:MAG: hypothetical protein IRZ03_08795 [Acidobacterium ailaaui]|nr:hypothetical protein [Pseudacidobacterium ailaaui]
MKLITEGKNFYRIILICIKHAHLTEEEELSLIDFTIQTINGDKHIEYSEIKFFKIIRHRLKVCNGKILECYPDFETYLEGDIVIEGFLDKITSQYSESIELLQFHLISLSDNSQDVTN